MGTAINTESQPGQPAGSAFHWSRWALVAASGERRLATLAAERAALAAALADGLGSR
jgi:hypothetical protein